VSGVGAGTIVAMIIVAEGPSAAGKTTWVQTHHSQVAVSEHRPSGDELDRSHDPDGAARFWAEANARRWERALEIEAAPRRLRHGPLRGLGAEVAPCESPHWIIVCRTHDRLHDGGGPRRSGDQRPAATKSRSPPKRLPTAVECTAERSIYRPRIAS